MGSAGKVSWLMTCRDIRCPGELVGIGLAVWDVPTVPDQKDFPFELDYPGIALLKTSSSVS
jgi:hypothetical protein